MRYYGWGPMMSGGFGLFGAFWMIAFWIIIALVIISLIRRHEEKKEKSGEKSALDILNERYAKGEINKKEYEEKKKDISKE